MRRVRPSALRGAAQNFTVAMASDEDGTSLNPAARRLGELQGGVRVRERTVDTMRAARLRPEEPPAVGYAYEGAWHCTKCAEARWGSDRIALRDPSTVDRYGAPLRCFTAPQAELLAQSVPASFFRCDDCRAPAGWVEP